MGLGGVLAGAQLAVSGATTLADKWGLSGGFVGFFHCGLRNVLTRIGSPQWRQLRKKEAGLIVGNLFGSNLFNGLAGGAAIGLVNAGPIGDAKLTGGSASNARRCSCGLFAGGQKATCRQDRRFVVTRHIPRCNAVVGRYVTLRHSRRLRPDSKFFTQN